MKTKQTFKLASTAFALIVGTQHLAALPQWPQDVQAVRNLAAPKLPDGYQKATSEQKAAMLKAADLLIRYDAVFCPYTEHKIYTHHWQAAKQNLNELKNAPFAKQLPEPFAAAFFKVADELEQIKQLPPAYGDDDLKDNKTLPENWAILDAICREELGFSLEQQCSLLRSRIWDISYESCSHIFQHLSEPWRTKGIIMSAPEKQIPLHNERVDKLLERLIAPNGYQGEASPELRKTIFDWYQADFLNRINQKKSHNADPIEPSLDHLPSDILQAFLHEKESIENFRSFQDEMLKKYGDTSEQRKWTDLERHLYYNKKNQPSSVRKKLDFVLTKYVGIGKTEYAEQLTTLLGQTIANKANINVDYFTGLPESPQDAGTYEKAKTQILTEWQTNGFPSMPLPYPGPRPLFLEKTQSAPGK